jgi:hypothetical protein
VGAAELSCSSVAQLGVLFLVGGGRWKKQRGGRDLGFHKGGGGLGPMRADRRCLGRRIQKGRGVR